MRWMPLQHALLEEYHLLEGRSIGGIITGVLIFQVLNYGLSFIGVSTYLQFIIKGIIIIAAVALDTRKYMKKK